MKTELYNYDIYPKVIETGKETTVAIAPLGFHARFSKESYDITVAPMNETIRNLPDRKYAQYTVCPENGILKFTHDFKSEGEYIIAFDAIEMHLYALEADLIGKRPYIGDLHVHSCHSDGRESPAVVAANYRKSGFDFLAITDHGKYEPSLEAIGAYKDAPVDLCLMAGEEVHAPENMSHYIHFGGNFSINKLAYDDAAAYRSEVSEIEKTLDMPEGVRQYSREYASLLWVCRKIREAGGCSVMAHPNWIHDHAYHKPMDLFFYELKEKPFDAFELIGGQPMWDNWTVYENQMQVSIWQQSREDGYFVPPVGSSDSHGTVNCEFNYFKIGKTVVLCDKLDKDSIIGAIRENRSVALEQYRGEKMPRCYGKHRYAAFVMFLLSEYFPLHDDLCYEEGRLMKDYACGSAEAKSRLAALRGQTGKLLEKYWANP